MNEGYSIPHGASARDVDSKDGMVFVTTPYGIDSEANALSHSLPGLSISQITCYHAPRYPSFVHAEK